ncbi:MAG: nitrilase [Spirochaetes bacterium]|nr:MAG: nitrilase [Spirochaetota bacterium]
MKIGYYQFNPEFGNVKKNIEKMTSALENVHADLIVLPELASSGYFFSNKEEPKRLSEKIPGLLSKEFLRLSKKTGTSYVVGFPEYAEEGIYNSAALIAPDGVTYIYRKTHLFFEEKKYFLPGNGYEIVEVKGYKIGILICFDHMFPEAARTLALKGAQIICHPSNLVIPEYGQLTTRVRALENRVFWILANRTGTEERGEGKLVYTGESQIISPKGEIINRAGVEEESLFVTEIQPEEAADKNITQFNNIIEDRRPEIYTL